MNKLLIILLIFIIFYIWNYKYNEFFDDPNKMIDFTMDENWLEYNRGNFKYLNYPPGYEISPIARELFDLLEKKNLIEQSKKLLEVQSIVLCQEKDNSETIRINNAIGLRINDLKTLGYQKRSNKINIYGKIRTDLAEFLLGTVTLIEEQLIELKKEENLSDEDNNKIRKYIDLFYSSHLVNSIIFC